LLAFSFFTRVCLSNDLKVQDALYLSKEEPSEFGDPQHHFIEDMRRGNQIGPEKERQTSQDPSGSVVAALVVQPTVIERIRQAKSGDAILMKIRAKVEDSRPLSV
jgi:hypothetical protein